MRLSRSAQQSIKRIVTNLLGDAARVRLFGSRLDDTGRGGDIDLLVEVDVSVEAPAELAAKLSVQIMRVCQGRKVDVVLMAPNLPQLPIHRIAQEQGVELES